MVEVHRQVKRQTQPVIECLECIAKEVVGLDKESLAETAHDAAGAAATRKVLQEMAKSAAISGAPDVAKKILKHGIPGVNVIYGAK